MKQTRNIFASISEHTTIFHFTTLLLQAEVEQLQAELFETLLGFSF
jgi:hypothetical protein